MSPRSGARATLFALATVLLLLPLACQQAARGGEVTRFVVDRPTVVIVAIDDDGTVRVILEFPPTAAGDPVVPTLPPTPKPNPPDGDGNDATMEDVVDTALNSIPMAWRRAVLDSLAAELAEALNNATAQPIDDVSAAILGRILYGLKGGATVIGPQVSALVGALYAVDDGTTTAERLGRLAAIVERRRGN